MTRSKLIHVGTFGRPVGLKGEISLVSYCTDLKNYFKKSILLDDRGQVKWNLENYRNYKKKIIVKIKDKATRQSVEYLKGKK